MTLPRQDRRAKPKNGPPAAALDPAVPNPAALRVYEQHVLGWMLHPANHSDVGEHLEDVDARHFHFPAHAEIWASLRAHASEPNLSAHVAIDLSAESAHRAVRELPGGINRYLSECKEYADLIGERELAHNVRLVREAYSRRRRLELHHRAGRALEEDNLEEYDAALTEMADLLLDGDGQGEDPDERLERQRRRSIKEAATRYIGMLGEEVVRLRARREAKRIVDAEEADHSPIVEPVSLADLLDEDDEDDVWRMEGLWPAGARILLAAGAKAGKTTTTGNVIRSLADGDSFLGVHGVAPLEPGKTVAVLDYEMPRRKIKQWLRDQRIRNVLAVMVWAERGRAGRFDLRDETVRALWIARLRAARVAVWIIDCLSPILSALGIQENDNTEVGAILDGINTVAEAAGVEDVLLIHHMGHGAERSRGASRLIGWPDVNWKLTRQRDDKDPSAEPDPNSPRYFSAYGRDVDVREGRLIYDPETRHLTFMEGGRKEDANTMHLRRMLVHVRDNPGLGSRVLHDEVGTKIASRDSARLALKVAVEKKYVVTTPGPRNGLQHTITALGRAQIMSMAAGPAADAVLLSGALEDVDCECGYFITGAAYAAGERQCIECRKGAAE